VRRNWALDREFAPSMPQVERDRLYAGWRKAVTRSLGWDDAT
jgi:glycerol kinase